MRTLNKLVFIALLTLSGMAWAGPADGAMLESTSGRKAPLSALRAPVTVVVCRDHDAPKAPALDATLKGLLEAAPEKTLRVLPVAEVPGLDHWPIAGFVRSAVHRAARDARAELFMDWSGEVPRRLGLPEDGLSLAVLDGAGEVRYRHAGVPDPSDLSELGRTVRALEEAAP